MAVAETQVKKSEARLQIVAQHKAVEGTEGEVNQNKPALKWM